MWKISFHPSLPSLTGQLCAALGETCEQCGRLCGREPRCKERLVTLLPSPPPHVTQQQQQQQQQHACCYEGGCHPVDTGRQQGALAVPVHWGQVHWVTTDSMTWLGRVIAHLLCCSITGEIWIRRRFSREWMIDRSPIIKPHVLNSRSTNTLH